jgi:hypothetical protein
VLVAGSCGLIGSNTTRSFARRGSRSWESIATAPHIGHATQHGGYKVRQVGEGEHHEQSHLYWSDKEKS